MRTHALQAEIIPGIIQGIPNSGPAANHSVWEPGIREQKSESPEMREEQNERGPNINGLLLWFSFVLCRSVLQIFLLFLSLGSWKTQKDRRKKVSGRQTIVESPKVVPSAAIARMAADAEYKLFYMT